MHKCVIVCLLVGDKYSTDYVVKLRNMVKRNTSVPHDFICFSDDPSVADILIEDPYLYEPVWHKLIILNHPSISKYDRKVFFDLDVIIHNSIDTLLHLPLVPSMLYVISSEWKPTNIRQLPGDTGINSSIMVWNDVPHITEHFLSRSDYYMIKYKGIDRFLWNEKMTYKTIPPNTAYSYREGATLTDNTQFKYRPEYSVCIFNQDPKPHTLSNDDMVREYWR